MAKTSSIIKPSTFLCNGLRHTVLTVEFHALAFSHCAYRWCCVSKARSDCLVCLSYCEHSIICSHQLHQKSRRYEVCAHMQEDSIKSILGSLEIHLFAVLKNITEGFLQIKLCLDRLQLGPGILS